MYLMHVSIMIFVGFGFLMTFLKSYSLSAVSLNLVASCVMLLATVLVVCLPSFQVWQYHIFVLHFLALLRHGSGCILAHIHDWSVLHKCGKCSVLMCFARSCPPHNAV